MSSVNVTAKFILLLSVLALLSPVFSLADGCVPGDECYQATAPAPVRAAAKQPAAVSQPAPVKAETLPAPMKEEPCGWGNRFSAGVPVWMFNKEPHDIGGGIYYDIYHCCYPVNFRIGAEVNHMDADQDNAMSAAEWSDRTDVNLTFVRIPFAIEYVYSFNDQTRMFIGGGPDIIHTANDITATSVGGHLSARFMRDINERIGLAVEAGYAWARVGTDEAGDVNLDNAFIIPSLVYTF